MIYAGVTLRLWVPLLVQVFDGDFPRAYSLVPFLCWVPNLLVVDLYLPGMHGLEVIKSVRLNLPDKA